MSGNTAPGGFDQPPSKQRSRWLWWVVLGFGSASFIGFLIVAWKVRTPKFFRAAVFACVGCGAGLASYTLWPPVVVPGPKAGSEVSDEVITSANSLWIVGAIWIGLIAYGLYLDGDVKKILRAQDEGNNLRWHQMRAQAAAFYKAGAGGSSTAAPYGASAHAPAPPPQPAVRLVDHLIAEADQFMKAQPSGNLPGPMPPNTPVT